MKGITLNKFIKLIPIFSVFIFTIGVSLTGWANTAEAADRYWVGGTGDWSNATEHWATVTGGAPAAENLPIDSDDCFIDANSGFGSGGIITLTTGAVCNDFAASSGHNYSINSGTSTSLSIVGSLTLESGITFGNNTSLSLEAVNEGKTITTAGATINELTLFGSGSWTLQDNLVVAKSFSQWYGTFDTNDHDVTANDFYFFSDTTFLSTVAMGSGTWTVAGNDDNSPNGAPWYIDEWDGGTVSINSETSTIKFTDTTSSSKTFLFSDSEGADLGKTYNNIWFAGAGSGPVIVQGSNTFNDFKADPGVTVQFTDDTTQTVSSFTTTGTAESMITLNGTDTAGWTLSAPTGTISSDYLNIDYSNATGGATFYAGANSIDGGHNTGWIFTAPPPSDSTPPTPNPPTMAYSSVTQTSIAWTLSTGTDAGVGLHTTPYGFATTSGGPYTYQATPSWTETDLTCATRYTRYGVIKDALGNVTDEASANIPTSVCSSNGSVGGTYIPPVVVPDYSGCTTGALFSTTTGQSCLGNPVITTITYNFGTATLRNGSRGEVVKDLQRFLNIQLNLNLVIDGILGPKTLTAIKIWQQANGLAVDGLVGPKTKEKMYAIIIQ
ncbi:MAG: peptidoglycan-binding domain-containing protein [Candidatus Paceibacterota bacterium]